MRRVLLLMLSGRGLPTPPAGYVFLVDTSGAYLVDTGGAYLVGKVP